MDTQNARLLLILKPNSSRLCYRLTMRHKHLWAKMTSHYVYAETMVQHSAELPLQSSVFAVLGTEIKDTTRTSPSVKVCEYVIHTLFLCQVRAEAVMTNIGHIIGHRVRCEVQAEAEDRVEHPAYNATKNNEMTARILWRPVLWRTRGQCDSISRVYVLWHLLWSISSTEN